MTTLMTTFSEQMQDELEPLPVPYRQPRPEKTDELKELKAENAKMKKTLSGLQDEKNTTLKKQVNKKAMDLAGSTKQDKRSLGILVPQRKDTTIASPCIDICYYTEEGICEGCFRNQEEIINWWAWDAPRKIQALRDIQVRRKIENEKN